MSSCVSAGVAGGGGGDEFVRFGDGVGVLVLGEVRSISFCWFNSWVEYLSTKATLPVLINNY